MPAPSPQRSLGLIAGAGEYPRLVIEGARRAGVRVVCAGIRGAADADIAGLCDVYRSFRVGNVQGPLDFFRREGVREGMLTGQIKPACIYTMWPDATARRELAQLERRNAHSIFGAVCRLAAEHGIRILPASTYMEANMPPAGLLAGPAPTGDQLAEAAFGMRIAKEIAWLDIGQSVIVSGRHILCIEGFKGTNECIEEGGHRPYAACLCKVTKAGHDMRFDVPCIGSGSIRHCINAGVRHIVIEAGRTILFQREEVLRLCNEHGICLHAMEAPTMEDRPPLPEHSGGDAEQASVLAHELEALGIGHAAVVCDGVVIAVEDPDGPLKCLARAGAYMKRIRFARLGNFLCRLLLGRKSARPAPMQMRGTARFEITPEIRRAAKRAHVRLD